MKKKILIVEAGPEQEKGFLIKEAVSMEYDFYLLQSALFSESNSWVSDWISPSNIINTVSLDQDEVSRELLNYMKEREVSFGGVLTFWEAQVPITQYIQEMLDLPRICNGDVRKLRHKGHMRCGLNDGVINQPKYVVISECDLSKGMELSLTYPLIVKPSEMASSLGVSKIYTHDQLKNAVEHARKVDFSDMKGSTRSFLSISDDVIVEEYIECDYEVSVEAVVYKGDLDVVAICEKITPVEPNYWEYGEITPAPSVDEDVRYKIETVMKGIASANELNNCIVHAEIRIKDSDLYFIEMGARIAGVPIPEIVALSTGKSLLKYAVRVSCDEEPNVKSVSECQYVADYSFNTQHSNIRYDQTSMKARADRIEAISGVKKLQLRDKVEDTMFGDIIVLGSTSTDVWRSIDRAKKIIEE